MRHGRARGASLFEFAVVVAVWGVLAGVLLFQVRRYQAEAERVGVRHQVEQMRSALLSRVLQAEVRDDPARLQALAGMNPVRLLQRPPVQYVGEFDNAELADIPPGSWYFDRKQHILVYLFNRNKSFSEDKRERWAFRVEFIRLPTNNAKPPGTPPTSGVALHQVDG